LRFQVLKIAKEILSQKQEAHIVQFKYHELQQRLNDAFESDKSHTKELSQ